MSIAQTNKAPKAVRKGVGAEVDAVGRICWQFGEYPPCCRFSAESYRGMDICTDTYAEG